MLTREMLLDAFDSLMDSELVPSVTDVESAMSTIET